MPSKKTMEQAKKLGMKGKGYKGGKSFKLKSMRGGRQTKSSMPQTFNEIIKKKIGGKV